MKVYAVKNKNEDVRLLSRSGGFFSALSDLFLNGDAVYGCVLDSDFNAIHIRAEDSFERDRMRGSKYLQSKMRDTFKSVYFDLKRGKKVLFSGTPCQVAGLKSFLKEDYPNLYCVDIVCHGVPSNKVWHDFLNWFSKGRKIKNIDFRNKKKYGWKAHVETIFFEDNEIDSEIYKELFYSHLTLRPSCYKCIYKNTHRPSDITIGDYWGIDTVVPGFNDNKGVSLVLVNSKKGEILFEQVQKDIEYVETKIEDSIQPPLKEPFPCPKNRDIFWEEYFANDFSYIVNKYGTKKKIPLYKIIGHYFKNKIKILFSK